MNGQSKTYTRVEHLDGPDGIRFHYIARHVALDGGDTRFDPNW